MAGINLLQRLSHEQLDDIQLRDLGLAYLGALRGITTGHGTEQQWHTLAASLNMAMVLAELGVVPQGLSAIESGLDALVRVRAHALNTHTWALGIHTFAIECAFTVHNRQIAEAGRNQMIAAINEVFRRLDAGHHRQ